MSPKLQNDLTSLQCRMARAGLRWTIPDLAAASGVGRTTILRFEGERTAPNPATLGTLRRALEEAGVEFVEDYGVLVRKPQGDAKA